MQQDKANKPEVSDSNWQYSNNEVTQAQPNSPQPIDNIKWSASEFIAYQKSAGWYVLILLGVLALGGAIFFLIHDIFSSSAIVIAGIMFLIFAARKPRVLEYSIDNNGVSIGAKKYLYKDFRSFSVIEETHMRSIMLTPLKRFMPAISMYFEPNDEQNIVEALSGYLPHEDRKQDPIDKIMQRLRF